MNRLTKRLISIAIITSCSVPLTANATNGYFLIGFGAKSRAMGGVGVAEGVDGLAAAFNPATMADAGTRFDIGADLFSVPRAVTHSDGTLSETVIIEESDSEDTAFSHNDLFLIPNMGATYEWNKDIALGFAFIGAGAATNYDQSLPAGNTSYFYNFNGLGGPANASGVGDPDSRVGIKLMQLQIPLSIAYKFNKHHTVGFSMVMAYQIFEGVGFGAFQDLNFGATQGDTTNNGTDSSYGIGWRLGWTSNFLGDNLRLGANYSARVDMSEFEKYKNLFAEQGDFDIPENFSLGFSYKSSNKIKVKFDFQQINYGDIKSVANPGPVAYNNTEFNPLCPGVDPIECKLGGSLGMGFGWDNQKIYKLGLENRYNPQWLLRIGFNHGEGVIEKDQVLFNMMAPATIENHLTLGATYDYSSDIELSFSYVHGFEKTVTGPTLFQPLGADPAVTVDNASVTMKQRALGASLGIKW